MCERNISWLPLMCPQPGTWLTTQACALTGTGTGDLSVHGPGLSPLSHTRLGLIMYFLKSPSQRAMEGLFQ